MNVVLGDLRSRNRPVRLLLMAVIPGSVLGYLVGAYGLTGAAISLGLALIILFVFSALSRPDVTYLGLLGLLLVQGWLAGIPGRGSPLGEAISRADDVLVILLAACVVASVTLRGEHLRAPYWSLSALILSAGGLSSLINEVPVGIAVLGGYLALKFYLMVIIAVNIDWPEDGARALQGVLFLGAIALVFGVLEWLLSAEARAVLALTTNVPDRLGLRAMQSFFIHPGVFGWLMASLTCTALARHIITGRRSDLAFSILFAVGALASLRLKPILGVALAVPLGLLVARRIRLRSYLGLAAGALVVVAAFGGVAAEIVSLQARSYVLAPDAGANARNVLYGASLQIAGDKFPLGVGFGRFGSWGSRLQYSPVYTEYGIAGVWGLSPNAPRFIMDTTWPSILGEAGVLGAAAFATLLLVLARGAAHVAISESSASASTAALAGFMVLVEALMESLGAPTLFQQPTVALLALPLGIALRKLRR